MTSKIHVARLALAQFVAEARPDWPRDDFDGQVHAALDGLPEAERPAAFASLVLRTARLMGIDDSSPMDLKQETRSATERARPVDPDDAERRDRAAAAAKAELAGALISIDQQRAERERAERDERNRQLAVAAETLAVIHGGDAG